MLAKHFPNDVAAVDRIMKDVRQNMKYMDLLYGVDNPILFDLKENKEYVLHTMLPWVMRYLPKAHKVGKPTMPIDEYLKTLTNNQVLVDMIAQHFFKKSPAFFSLSYFSLYLDYRYPKAGTGSLTQALSNYITTHQGSVQTDTMIQGVDPQSKQITDAQGNVYEYDTLIWAADQKQLYTNLNLEKLANGKQRDAIQQRQKAIADLSGGDSIFTLYLTVDADPSFFASRCTEHFFYTPKIVGLNSIAVEEEELLSFEKEQLMEWVKQFFECNTFEISIPALRNAALAPDGQTGLIISTLFDYDLMRYIVDMGWYEEFCALSKQTIIEVLEASRFHGFKEKIMDQFTATPLTFEKYTANSGGAITGWAFTNSTMPAQNKMIHILKTIKTPIPGVVQAGQWTFSPSGLPISVLTGKLAADYAIKHRKPSK
ncbi:MAG: phytoene desaturase family protein [Erysipelotrichaceae bacterium]